MRDDELRLFWAMMAPSTNTNNVAAVGTTDALHVKQQWSYRQVLDLPKYASTPSPLTPAGL